MISGTYDLIVGVVVDTETGTGLKCDSIDQVCIPSHTRGYYFS